MLHGTSIVPMKRRQKVSTAKYGISERSARRIDHQPNPPAPKPRHWCTRKVPLKVVCNHKAYFESVSWIIALIVEFVGIESLHHSLAAID